MTSFFVRVQLNTTAAGSAPNSFTYARLHTAMERAGCNRQVVGVVHGRNNYSLPHGEYHTNSPLTSSQLRDLICEIVDEIWADSDVLVIESSDAAWRLYKVA